MPDSADRPRLSVSALDRFPAITLLGDTTDWVELELTRFTMGCDDRLAKYDDDEGPTREVSIAPLVVSATPISVEAFSQFVGDTSHESEAERAGTGFRATNNGDHELVDGVTWRSDVANPSAPVNQLSWVDAFEFCRWSGTRLLTEAEWERCAREATTEASFLAGHIEWTADYYSPSHHRTEQRVNPTGPIAGTRRVARGRGSPSKRIPLLPDMSSDDLFFRVAARK